MSLDLIVGNARLRSGKIADIAIAGGRIQVLKEKLAGSANQMIDAQNRLVTEPFVVAHLHLDKVMTGPLAEEGALSEYHASSKEGPIAAIEMASKVKAHYVESEIVNRGVALLREAEQYGVRHLRAFADVDTKAELKGIRALLKIKDEFKDRIGLQIVAFPQDGIIKEPGTEELLYKAMDLGADVVGGIPWIEPTEEDSEKHVRIVYEIAKKYDADVSMLTDDAADPKLRTTEYLATYALKTGWIGRTSACHARGTGMYDEARHSKLVELLKQAQVGIVTEPQTGPAHVKVKELLNAGITVALGQDDVNDAYYPYGRCNMLEVAFLASHLLWMMTRQDREKIYDMITFNAAKILRIKNYGLAAGNPADLIMLDAEDLRQAFASHTRPLCVIRNGRVVL
jgi:cytosine deaminase